MITVIGLYTLGRDDIARAGGKGANLGELIKAREYGIPAIMGTGRGTNLLSNGQLVTVDGGSGRVVAYQPEA